MCRKRLVLSPPDLKCPGLMVTLLRPSAFPSLPLVESGRAACQLMQITNIYIAIKAIQDKSRTSEPFSLSNFTVYLCLVLPHFTRHLVPIHHL